MVPQDHLEEFDAIRHGIEGILVMHGDPLVLVMMDWPWLQHFPIFSKAFTKLDASYEKVFAHIDRFIQKREEMNKKKSTTEVEHCSSGNGWKKNEDDEEKEEGEAVEVQEEYADFVDCFLAQIERSQGMMPESKYFKSVN